MLSFKNQILLNVLLNKVIKIVKEMYGKYDKKFAK